MALAKLCACACGGAIVGGGAVHVAETSGPAEVRAAQPRVAARQIGHRPTARRTVRRVRQVTTTTSCPQTPTVVSVTNQVAGPAPQPVPAVYEVPPPAPIPYGEVPSFGGGGAVEVIGGGGGFGGGFGGGGFFGGFIGGGGGGGSSGGFFVREGDIIVRN
ncbi:MAG: hypothetical protein RLN87_00975, partial [Parasphingopyxis sp.]